MTATVIMGAGLLRAEVHPYYDASSIFELLCFLAASALLAFPLVWLWRSRKEHFRLLVLLWVVAVQELVCADQFVGLLRRALQI